MNSVENVLEIWCYTSMWLSNVAFYRFLSISWHHVAKHIATLDIMSLIAILWIVRDFFVLERILGKYLKDLLESSSETTRCGCALAIGALPQSFLSGLLNLIIPKLIAASKMTSKQAPFVLARRDCLKALTWYCCTKCWRFCNIFLGRSEKQRPCSEWVRCCDNGMLLSLNT